MPARSYVNPEIDLLDWDLLWGFLTYESTPPTFQCRLFCSSHSVQQTSLTWPFQVTHSPDSLQAVRHVRRMKRRVTDTWKARNLQGWRLKMALENTVCILLRLKKKGHFIGKEMTPLDLLSCDISVFQVSHPTIFNAHESNILLWSMFDCCSSM